MLNGFNDFVNLTCTEIRTRGLATPETIQRISEIYFFSKAKYDSSEITAQFQLPHLEILP